MTATAEVAPSKLGSFYNECWELKLTFGRMGNGGVLESGGGQLGVCHTTGCRYNNPPLMLKAADFPRYQVLHSGVTLVTHLLVDPRESLILITAVTVMTSHFSSLQSRPVPTFTPARSWNHLRLIAMGRSLPGRPAGEHPRD